MSSEQVEIVMMLLGAAVLLNNICTLLVICRMRRMEGTP